jgi:hypothetical protein
MICRPGNGRSMPRRRGVAQLEFVANLPLILAFLGLVILAGVALMMGAGLVASRLDAIGRASQAAQRASDGNGGDAPDLSYQPRSPLQVPDRFDVSGDKRIAHVLEPIRNLARSNPLVPEVKP